MAKKLHNIQSLKRGMFVACVYEIEWQRYITEISTELQEVTVNFMSPHGPSKGYNFPSTKQLAFHSCAIEVQNILKTIDVPVPVGTSARAYKILDTETKVIEELFCIHHGVG